MTAPLGQSAQRIVVDTIKGGRRRFRSGLHGPTALAKRRRMPCGWSEAAGQRPVLLPEIARRARPAALGQRSQVWGTASFWDTGKFVSGG